MKKIISIFTAVIISVLSLSVLNVSAKSISDSSVEIQWTYTNSVLSRIETSGNSATCISKVSATSGVTRIMITQSLQKYVSGSWADHKPAKVKTFYSSPANFINTYDNLSSGTYRTKTVVDVYMGNAHESIAPVYSSNGII